MTSAARAAATTCPRGSPHPSAAAALQERGKRPGEPINEMPVSAFVRAHIREPRRCTSVDFEQAPGLRIFERGGNSGWSIAGAVAPLPEQSVLFSEVANMNSRIGLLTGIALLSASSAFAKPIEIRETQRIDLVTNGSADLEAWDVEIDTTGIIVGGRRGTEYGAFMFERNAAGI